MNDVNRELLFDLAKIFRRYETDDWKAFAKALETETSRLQLIEFFTGLAELSQASKKTLPRSGDKLQKIPAFIAEMRNRDPRKHEALIQAREALLSGTVLRTLRDLRDF